MKLLRILITTIMLETAGLFGIGSAYHYNICFMLHSSVFYIVTVTSQRQNEIA
jgi:hypothetical protein